MKRVKYATPMMTSLASGCRSRGWLKHLMITWDTAGDDPCPAKDRSKALHFELLIRIWTLEGDEGKGGSKRTFPGNVQLNGLPRNTFVVNCTF